MIKDRHPIAEEVRRKKISIAVVIPAYDEEIHIQRVVRSIPDWIRWIIIVDDGSKDSTVDKILQMNDSRIILLRHMRNLGVGAAIASGYAESLKTGSQITVVMGGDGQMDPEDLPDIVRPILNGVVHYVKGNRFLNRDSCRDMPCSRRIGNMLFSHMTRWAARNKSVFDSQCGYTAISGELLNRLDLSNLFPSYGFPNDLLFKIFRLNAAVAEVPVRTIYGTQTSKIKPFRHIPFIVWLILRAAVQFRMNCSREGDRRLGHTVRHKSTDGSAA